MTRYRVVLQPELARQFTALAQAAKTQPGGLRDREFRALKIALGAIAKGNEADFDGKRLGYSPRHHDLRDCAEIKIAVVQESRHNRELGPSHRLVYREFEAEDGGPPVREVIAFEHRGNDRPFAVAGARLGRETGTRLRTLHGVADQRPHNGPARSGEVSPVRQPLPPDLRAALAAASGVADARGAARPPADRSSPPVRRGGPSDPGRQR